MNLCWFTPRVRSTAIVLLIPRCFFFVYDKAKRKGLLIKGKEGLFFLKRARGKTYPTRRTTSLIYLRIIEVVHHVVPFSIP